jgi:malonyl-CoA/methylmalonyl-CoA synthetase
LKVVETAFVQRLVAHGDRIALRASEGTRTYRQLLGDTERGACALRGPRDDLAEARVAYMVRPSYGYVAAMISAWRAGAMAVPIGVTMPDPEIEYLLDDATPEVVVADDEFAARLEPLARVRGIRLVLVADLLTGATSSLPTIDESRAAMMLYTSGTTGRPKGVVHTHASLAAQVQCLVEMWAWTEDDHILCVLPLHHVHGIVNVIGCALWSGAVCDIASAFDAEVTWNALASGDLTLFMAVPTIYLRLIQWYEAQAADERQRLTEGASQLRLMVSGSAALPIATLDRWHEITGHTLLERYGMTEIGMALSNTLTDRRAGHVGVPVPGMDVQLVDGEIRVRGPNVFREYWSRPDATGAAFADGWFCTGDVAVIEDGSHRILGRASVDIVKSGGEKISTLEIEDVLREHPSIVDCAVVGVPDAEWGERVCAALVVLDEPGDVRAWAKERLAPHKVPRDFAVVEELPRNAMGKVTKPSVVELFSSE